MFRVNTVTSGAIKRSPILKQTQNFKLQVCLCMYGTLLTRKRKRYFNLELI